MDVVQWENEALDRECQAMPVVWNFASTSNLIDFQNMPIQILYDKLIEYIEWVLVCSYVHQV